VRRFALLLLLGMVMAAPALCRQQRSHAAVAKFKASHPCPANGASRGKCPGYVVDHVKPLCAGGADAPSNMQWQTVADGKAKDRLERQECRRR